GFGRPSSTTGVMRSLYKIDSPCPSRKDGAAVIESEVTVTEVRRCLRAPRPLPDPDGRRVTSCARMMHKQPRGPCHLMHGHERSYMPNKLRAKNAANNNVTSSTVVPTPHGR